MKKANRKHLKKYILWGAMAAVVMLLAAMPLLAAPGEEADGPQASILSGTVQTGSVGASIRGGGNLQATDREIVELPSGVKITEFLVKNGDTVTEGTPLATVDKVTLMEAIVQVQDTLDYLQEKMAEGKDDKVSAYVKATPGGRVKKLYAQPGESVREVMLRDGCLAILSLDGLMAVSIERNMPLSMGEAVCVTFADAAEVSGRVESNINGKIVVTLEDDSYPIGETVTVTTEDGARVGSGALYVHNPWTATGFTGTVSSVSAKEESNVYSGAILMTLTDRDFTAEVERLADEHREYEALLQDMLVMYENGAVLSPCDGVVSGIDEESPCLLASEEIRWEAQPLSDTAKTPWRIVLLSNVEDAPPEVEDTPAQLPDVEQVTPGNPGAEAPEFWVGVCTRDDSCTAQLHLEGCPKGESGETDSPLYTGWAAQVITVDAENGITWVLKNPNGITVADPANPPAIDTAAMTEVTTIPQTTYADGSAMAAGDILLLVDGGGVVKLSVSGGRPGGSEGDMPAMGGMGGISGGAAAQVPAFEPYPLEGSTLLTVTSREEMTVTITLDEQDIAKVHQGQTAEVKISALRGQTVEGVVTDVAIRGTNSGGSSKFTVEVTLPAGEQMLAGMSATVTIPLYTKMEVLTVPVAALVENGTETQVFTALDPETGAPGSPVTVTVGLSDGETAEILSGLSSGDTFYYSYYDTLELSTEVERASGFGR